MASNYDWKKYRETQARYARERRRRFRDRLDVIKEARGCCVCGEGDPVCLEFHRRDPEAKEFNIGSATGRSWARVLEEIRKCSVICANCHRKHTRNEWRKKNAKS